MSQILLYCSTKELVCINRKQACLTCTYTYMGRPLRNADCSLNEQCRDFSRYSLHMYPACVTTKWGCRSYGDFSESRF